ncbi:MAG: hypothetical protein ACAH80_03275 [Alphaproteobacteria bacterium]
MNVKPLFNLMKLPFILPKLIADRVKPNISILSSDESLDRRILGSHIFGTFFGLTATVGFLGGVLLTGGVMLGLSSAALLTPGLALLGVGYMTAPMAMICTKMRIECIAVKVMNAMVAQRKAQEANAPSALPASQTPDFNQAAAAALDKDIKAMPAIKFAKRGVSP